MIEKDKNFLYHVVFCTIQGDNHVMTIKGDALFETDEKTGVAIY